MAAADSALPAAGAAAVSPQTSIVLVTGAQALPAGLELLAAGAPVPLPPIVLLGPGLRAGRWATFWRLEAALEPNTDYVLRAADGAGTRELTHLSTAASYDKTPGTPAQLTRLRLWRVRYPLDQIAAGGCVFSEFEGYFALDFTPAALPGTPAEEMVSVLSLAAKTGGTPLKLVFSGTGTLPGGLITGAPIGAGVSLPGGEGLSPAAALWKPELQPDREYCATIFTFGRNDRAASPVSSNVVCAPVTNLDAVAGGGSTAEGDGGTTAGGDGAGGDVSAHGDAGGPARKGGCAVGGQRGAGAPAALLMLLLTLGARRRRQRPPSTRMRTPRSRKFAEGELDEKG